jgi:hypothetical protein
MLKLRSGLGRSMLALAGLTLLATVPAQAALIPNGTFVVGSAFGHGAWNVRDGSLEPGETIQLFPGSFAPNEIFEFVFQGTSRFGEEIYIIHPQNRSLCLSPTPALDPPAPGQDRNMLWNIEQSTCLTDWHRCVQYWIIEQHAPQGIGDHPSFVFRSMMDGPYSSPSGGWIADKGAFNRLLIDGHGGSDHFFLYHADTGAQHPW